MAEPLAVVTPWYPTRTRPFHGSFVRGFVNAVREQSGRDVHVYHLEAWGMPAEPRAAARVRDDLASILRERTRSVPVHGEDAHVHLPSPVTPNASFGRIADDHHRWFRSLYGGRLPEPIVHAHVGLGGGWPAVGMMGRDARLFVTEHATFLDRLFEEPSARRHYDQVIARSTGFFCVSEHLRSTLLEYFPRREAEVSVIPNPIRFDDIPRRERARDPQLRRWLYVGYLTERKGVVELLEAFALAQATHGDLNLTLVGEGPLAEDLARRAVELGVEDSVDLPGPVAPERMPMVYEDHDLLVHLSSYETFGMTLVEAVAVGCPVIVTRCGGPEETVGPIIDQVGALVGVERDPEEVAAAYDDLRARADDLDLLAGRQDLESRYGHAAVASQLEAAYATGGTA